MSFFLNVAFRANVCVQFLTTIMYKPTSDDG